jgi:hypothetical protein
MIFSFQIVWVVWIIAYLQSFKVPNKPKAHGFRSGGGGGNNSLIITLISRDRFPVVSLVIISVATNGTMCLGVESASKNEYQGFLVG